MHGKTIATVSAHVRHLAKSAAAAESADAKAFKPSRSAVLVAVRLSLAISTAATASDFSMPLWQHGSAGSSPK